jgi:hypothetical protein
LQVYVTAAPRLQAIGQFLAGNAVYLGPGCHTHGHDPLICLKMQQRPSGRCLLLTPYPGKGTVAAASKYLMEIEMNEAMMLKLSAHPSGRLTLQRKEPGKGLFQDVREPALFGNDDRATFWEAVARYMADMINAGEKFRIDLEK